MTVTPPDPDPARTPGLEPRGGVAPGEIPPAAARISGLAIAQPSARHRLTPASVVSLIVATVSILLLVVTGVLIVLNLVV